MPLYAKISWVNCLLAEASYSAYRHECGIDFLIWLLTRISKNIEFVFLCFSENSGCSQLEFTSFAMNFSRKRYQNVHRNSSNPLLHHNPPLSCPSVCSLCSKQKTQLPGRASSSGEMDYAAGVFDLKSFTLFWNLNLLYPTCFKVTTSAVEHELQAIYSHLQSTGGVFDCEKIEFGWSIAWKCPHPAYFCFTLCTKGWVDYLCVLICNYIECPMINIWLSNKPLVHID